MSISSTIITNWVSQNLFSLNPCCGSNSMLELGSISKMFSEVGFDCVPALCTKHIWEISGDNLLGLTDLLFLKMGDTFASFQIWGSFLGSSDFWKITCSIGASSAWRACRTMGFFILLLLFFFQEDSIFGTDASLTYGPQIQRHTCVW